MLGVRVERCARLEAVVQRVDAHAAVHVLAVAVGILHAVRARALQVFPQVADGVVAHGRFEALHASVRPSYALAHLGPLVVQV